VATDSVRTAGVPAGISLKPDRVKIRADGEDLCFIDVSVVDKDGTICPNAANSLTFSVQGPAMTLAALDDGDPTNHESFQGTQHRVFHGRGLAVLKSAGDMAGSTILTVKSDGLPPMSCTVKSLLNLAGNQHGQSDGPPPASSAN
jgi:beta-galactosidase